MLTLLVVVIATGIAVATSSTANAAKPCWRSVLDDWTDDKRLDKRYEIRCYDQALENLPEDIVSYTDAYDQIADARQAALRGDIDRETSGSDSQAAGGGDPDDSGGGGGGAFDDVFGIGSGDSDSIPLPLLILGALAGLLMAAGAAGLLARKLQARRPGGPAPPPE